MTLIGCPECRKQISDQAASCPQCGHPMRQITGYGFEYRTIQTIGGWPLVHIATGIDGVTGRKRIAKGIIAIGDVAVGGLAVGGVSLGVFSLGGMAVGYAALGGCAVGVYACGGAAYGEHVISAAQNDPQALEFFKRFLGESFTQSFGASR